LLYLGTLVMPTSVNFVSRRRTTRRRAADALRN